MQQQLFYLPLFLLFCTWACQESETPSEVENGGITLFQEEAEDWTESGVADWTFENATIIGTSLDSSGFLITKTAYSDFVLELEFYPDSTINSGVFIRCQTEDMNAETCDEINIWDLHPNQGSRTGALVTKAEPLATVYTLNQWNTYRIRSEGEHLQAWVNDTMTIDYQDTLLSSGLIGLQAGGTGTIKFRNVQLLPLK